MKIAIVPARGGSKRIPDKNIVDFLGSPLMSYSIRAAEKSGLFDAIHVSTDSERIAGVAAQFGYPVEFLRAPALADDYTPLLPVLQWTLEQYELRGKSFQSVCLLMPTAPLIDAGDLIRGHDVFRERGGSRTVMAVSRFSVPVEWAFHLEADGTLTACQPGMSNVRSQDLRPAYYDSGTFLFIPAVEAKAGRIDDARMIAFPIPRYKAVDIDDAEDLELASIIARGLNHQ
jgi:pseudaminic acid cytidylyltransferase